MGYAHRRDVEDNWMYEMKILITTGTHTSFDPEIPVALKASISSPIYKKGSKNGVANNRPICRTSRTKKVKENILQHLKAASFFSHAQHGLVYRLSCTTTLIIADQGEPVDVVYLGLSKSFYPMYHRLPIKKMAAMRI